MVAGGFRTFVAGETLDEDKINDFLMQGVLVFDDSAARGSAITSPVHGQVSFLKDSNTTEFYDSTAWVALGVTTFNAANVTGTTGSPGTATSGGYTYYTFTGTGSIAFGRDGLLDVLMIGAGGGGGDGQAAQGSGGGGAADIRQLNNVYIQAGTATITVGGGGAGSTVNTVPGSSGDFSALGIGTVDASHVVAIGGGGGGSFNTPGTNGIDGGSGGGMPSTANGRPGSGITQFGGGNGLGGDGGGGGGGAGAVGGNASATGGGTGGAGGAGLNTYATWATATSTGVSDFYAGGGGGGGDGTGGAAGSGGGGAGGTGGTNGGNATANTGSGGGGTESGDGGNGGSGLVIVRVLA